MQELQEWAEAQAKRRDRKASLSEADRMHLLAEDYRRIAEDYCRFAEVYRRIAANYRQIAEDYRQGRILPPRRED